MTSGNIDCGSGTLELGTGTTATTSGTLTYTNGNIIGKFKRWFDATGAKRFPLGTSAGSGTASANRNALVTFTNLTNGSLTGSFIATDPGSTGLPLTESSLTIGSQFTEGYWSLVAANSLASTNYDLELTGQGFSSQTQDATVRIIKRPDGGGNWTLNGSHVAAVGAVAKRSGLSGFSEFAHAAVCPNPTIDVPPASVTKCVGESASFSVTATGPGALTYQWYKSPSTLLTNGGAISGATTATLTINPVALADNASSYYVVVTRSCGSTASSSAATLTVNPLPTITLGANPAVCQGVTSANLTYSATTNGANQYSVNFNGTAETAGFVDVNNLSLSGSPIVLTVPANAPAGVYGADLTVRNSTTGCVSSISNISVTVRARPTAVITGATTICNGGSANLSITFTGTGLFTYAINDGAPTVATSNPEIVSVSPSTSTTYTVSSLSDANCTSIAADLTSSADITVNPLPTITLGANPAVCQGVTSANLTYSATTNGANQYSVNFNGTAETAGFVDVTNSTLSGSPIVLTVPANAPAGVYGADLTVRNSTTGCVSSVSAVTITVWDRPTAGTCNQTDDYCYTNAGHIDIKASGGLASYGVTWSPAHGMSQPATIMNSGDIIQVTGLHAATSYTFVVTDAHGCTAQ